MEQDKHQRPAVEMVICKWLRWKGSHLRQDPRAVVGVFSKNSVQYSCLQTMQVWSPEGDLVAPECCGEHRSCFQPKRLTGSEGPSLAQVLSERQDLTKG